jgi:hypothetical protein
MHAYELLGVDAPDVMSELEKLGVKNFSPKLIGYDTVP